MTKTRIEWTTDVWNPTTGCNRVSPGCDNCYALTLAKRLKGMGSAKYQRDGDPRTSGPGFGLTVHPDALDAPLRWRKPRRVFVNSMSDLFHDAVPDEFIARVFAVMALAPQHTFQVLTKRHGRMRSLLNNAYFWQELVARSAAALDMHDATTSWTAGAHPPVLRNVWLGVSVENRKWAEIRGAALRDTPAVVRFWSAEPLLGPLGDVNLDGVGWVICGGESGPGARPMHVGWARSLRDQCVAAGVPFFLKQWGAWVSPDHMPADTFMSWDAEHGTSAYDRERPWRVGKKRAGRELDGRTWEEYPAGAG